MVRQAFRECLVVLIGTMVFVALAATVGIPGREPKPTPAVAAEEAFVQPLIPLEDHWRR